MDFTSPIGKVILATLAAFAQYYSDNLSAETKKGKAERKAQGLYNGLLPFGLKKNSEGIPVPDPETYPGLLLAFRLAAEGKSDREVAEALNAADYRTTGNRGRNPFTKDTVCRLLQNRFYLGELPDGAGGWQGAAHEPVLDDALFERAIQARQANRTANAERVNRRHRRYSLSGLAVCGTCGGRLHFHTDRGGRARVYCYQERQASRCGQRSTFLAGIEDQIGTYVALFQLPQETVEHLVALYEQSHTERDDTDRRRREIEARLGRMAELYTWGDLTRDAYRVEREALEAERQMLEGTISGASILARTAALLRDLPAAWAAATPAERNELARLMFQRVEITDDRVTAVVPQVDFAPFFALVETDTTTGQPLLAAPDRLVSTLAGGSDGGRSRGCVTTTPGWSLPRRPSAAELGHLGGQPSKGSGLAA